MSFTICFVSIVGAGDDGYSMGLENQRPVGKIGAKKQRRLEMKEERKLMREVWNFLLCDQTMDRVMCLF